MWTVTLGTTSGVSSSILASIQQITLEAANYWGRYINFGSATIDIRVNIVNLGQTTLAQAGPDFFPTQVVSGAQVFQAGPILEIQTGVDPNGSTPDIDIDVNLTSINENEYYYGGLSNPNVPFAQFDLFTILAHEIGHGIGFISFDPANAAANRAEFDLFKSGNFFTGPRAVAVYGGNVPLQNGDGSHLADFDLLFPSISNGERNFVSALDIAILADAGLPILEPTAGDDSLFGFERFVDGGALVGGNDVIALLAGADWYNGLSGTDSVDGGAGNDTLLGGSGNDTLRGGADNDLIDGGDGFDSLFGDDGDDLFVNGGSDAYDGGAGTDTVSYASAVGAIRIIGGAGTLGLATSATFVSIERIIGGGGNDTISGLAANEEFIGGGGADSLSGADGDDTLNGGLGADTLNGGAGLDTADYSDRTGAVNVNLFNGVAVTGGALNASGFYVGGATEDQLLAIEAAVGSGFGDRLVGANSAERIEGRGGADNIAGLNGADTLLGGDGDDTLNGGAGNDTLDGGDGFDTASYADRTGGVNVNLFNGVAVTGGAVNAAGFYQGGAVEDTILSIESVIGSPFADRLIAANGAERLDGGAGNDLLFGLNGADQLFGGDGNDTVNGGLGADTLNGGAGTDTADYSNRTGAVNVNLFNGVAVTGGSLNASGFYVNGVTEDQITSIEVVFGSNFGDRLVAGSFASRLEGRGGNDNIAGLSGADTLVGGAGDDTLAGGAGADTFEFAPGFGADRIADFDEGASVSDVIRLVGLGEFFDSFEEVIAVATEAGADVIFDFGGGDTITVAGAAIAGFDANDFSFG
ncbi:MAG: hypothetical protein ACK4NP_08865 [Parvularculaceae bacterium]